MPHQRLHRGKEARAGGEILPFRCGDFSGGALHPCRLHVKEIPLHQEMVSVTGSVTWISYSSSDIDAHGSQATNGMKSTPAATGRKEPQEAVRPPAQRRNQRCHSPSRRRSRAESTDSPTGAERQLKVLKRQRMRWSIASGVSSPAGLFSRPDSLRVKRKRILGLMAASPTLHYLGALIGAFKPNVERQSVSYKRNYLQAIADLEIESSS